LHKIWLPSQEVKNTMGLSIRSTEVLWKLHVWLHSLEKLPFKSHGFVLAILSCTLCSSVGSSIQERTKHVWVNAITSMHGLDLFPAGVKFTFSQLVSTFG